MAVLRWHASADPHNLRADKKLSDCRSFTDMNDYDPAYAKWLLRDPKQQQEYERDSGQGLEDQEELHLDSPRVLNRVRDNLELGVKEKDIEELIVHFNRVFVNGLRGPCAGTEQDGPRAYEDRRSSEEHQAGQTTRISDKSWRTRSLTAYEVDSQSDNMR